MLPIVTSSFQYIVTGQGYNLTRHNNNNVATNIETDVFLDDKPLPIIQAFPNRGAKKRQTQLPPIKKPKEQ